MRILNRPVIAGVCVLAASCSSSTKQARTYWTKEAGVFVIHHVVGKTDSMEKLTQNELSSDEVKVVGLPKGKYFKVVDAQGKVTPAATQSAPAKKVDVEKKDSLAELSKQLRALKSQVKTVEAQNQRLQDEMNASERQKTAQEQPVEGQADVQPDVRLSQ
jgi:Tfp pilus assembly protein FimV